MYQFLVYLRLVCFIYMLGLGFSILALVVSVVMCNTYFLLPKFFMCDI